MTVIRLEHGRTRVEIDAAAGGRVAQIEIYDGQRWIGLLHDAVQVTGSRRDPLGWGSYVMAPWPNRVAGGRFRYAGREYVLPRNSGGHALHGLVFDRAWDVEASDASSATLTVEFAAPWPWRARCQHAVAVVDDGITQRIEIEAIDSAFPAGCGWHPWFRRDVGNAPVALRVDSSERYELADMIPTGRIVEPQGLLDLRSAPVIADRRVDDCYRLSGSIQVRWGRLTLEMQSSPTVGHAVVYTPDHVVCVEPQTCAIDAFNLEARGVAAGIQVVTPDRPLVASTAWRWSVDGD